MGSMWPRVERVAVGLLIKRSSISPRGSVYAVRLPGGEVVPRARINPAVICSSATSKQIPQHISPELHPSPAPEEPEERGVLAPESNHRRVSASRIRIRFT